jgi:hypothetical protein
MSSGISTTAMYGTARLARRTGMDRSTSVVVGFGAHEG